MSVPLLNLGLDLPWKPLLLTHRLQTTIHKYFLPWIFYLRKSIDKKKKKKKKKEKTTNLTPDTVRLKKSEKSELIGELANLTGVKNFAALL